MKTWQVTDVNVLRRELFKIFYKENLFNLNSKADSAEAFSTILKMMHMIYTDPKLRGKAKDFDGEMDTKCTPPCLIH